MGYRNPWRARLAQHKKRWPVPLLELQRDAYGVLMIALEGVAVDDDEQRRKNILCFFQGLTALTRLQESVELEARLSDLERRVAETNHHGAIH